MDFGFARGKGQRHGCRGGEKAEEVEKEEKIGGRRTVTSGNVIPALTVVCQQRGQMKAV